MSADPVAAGLREQLDSWRAELRGGATRIGWKIGFNLPAARERLGLDEPLIGFLTSATLLDDGAAYDAAAATRLVAEPEIAIEIGEDGGIASYAPAIELADFDRPLERSELQAILAEDIFHRGLVLGESRPGLSEPPRARVLVDGEERAAAQAPADYFDGVVELTSRLLESEGEQLRAGDRVICGVITAPVPVGPGDSVTVDVGELGTLGVSFSD